MRRIRANEPGFARSCCGKCPSFPAPQPLLESLSSYRLAVVTSSGRDEVEPILEKAGLLDFFGAAVYFQDVKNIKPHPEPYLRAAGLLGATMPLVVEDSEAGEESGRSAGFDVLRVSSADEVPEALARKLQLPV